VNTHLVCLTVDTDPDGLGGKVTNRQALKWEGLENLQRLPEHTGPFPLFGEIPITWFIRADGQVESILGNTAYLLEKYDSWWTTVRKAGHEMAWHPHLYRQSRPEDEAVIITDPAEAQDELERLWANVRTSLPATSFRHGEGWHSAETYATVERLGFLCDSTAIPGRTGGVRHPMDWVGAPNQAYFPSSSDLRQAGPQRPLLEIPMNTWLVQAPYDAAPRVRYINPAVHPKLFANALQNWENTRNFSPFELHIWVMIFHPDEVLPSQGEDNLYSRSAAALCSNLACFRDSLHRAGIDIEWVTISRAADRWRKQHGGQPS
jgi:hypothetical protein